LFIELSCSALLTDDKDQHFDKATCETGATDKNGAGALVIPCGWTLLNRGLELFDGFTSDGAFIDNSLFSGNCNTIGWELAATIDQQNVTHYDIVFMDFYGLTISEPFELVGTLLNSIQLLKLFLLLIVVHRCYHRNHCYCQ
jgi:hypothetical protein